MQKIRFAQKTHAPFYREVKEEAASYLGAHGKTRYADRFFWCKAAVNLAVMSGAYALLVSGATANPLVLLLCALLFGVSGLLLIFNVAHDAVHGTLMPSRLGNAIIYRLCFVPVGISGRLWAMRHLHSHHVFTNVNGSDIDIDENPFLRLSPNHARRSYQRYQHLYAPLVYWIALPHTTFYQDFRYLFKRELANMRDIRHPWYEYLLFFVEKAVYFALVLVVPFLAIDLPAWQVALGYAIMAATVSLVFVLTLVGTHFALETQFPAADAHGTLPGDWASHVLKTSLDWSPQSRAMTALFGGANAHVAHHLFPSTCHVHYAAFTPMIRAAAKRHGLGYNETTLWRMLGSHFRFLKRMAQDDAPRPFVWTIDGAVAVAG